MPAGWKEWLHSNQRTQSGRSGKHASKSRYPEGFKWTCMDLATVTQTKHIQAGSKSIRAVLTFFTIFMQLKFVLSGNVPGHIQISVHDRQSGMHLGRGCQQVAPFCFFETSEPNKKCPEQWWTKDNIQGQLQLVIWPPHLWPAHHLVRRRCLLLSPGLPENEFFVPAEVV